MTAIDDADFAALTRQISRESGLTLDLYKDKCIRRRIAVRMRACGVHSYADYRTVLQRSPHEYERLRDTLTINVTRFYRNAETWNLLRREVIPDLCAAGEGDVLAWSAGCSSGEEPYTLAMLFAERMDHAGLPQALDRVTIDATDIDRGSLERARSARYRLEAVSEMPSELVQAYCEPRGLERQVIERVRRRVRILARDLSTEPPRRDYRLILCRNVVIYFDRPMQERLFTVFAESLAPGGYLVLGKVETLFGPARDRLVLVDARERVYRRPA
jgi:chemotaxis methyl-accepting protein methylase